MTRFGIRDDCCGLHSWAGKPLVSPETHKARKRAHSIFDALWKGPRKIMDRTSAYKRLAAVLNMHPRDCHIAQMDEQTANRVPKAVVQIRAEALLGETGAKAFIAMQEALE